MFDLNALKTFLEPIGWFMSLGKQDIQNMRDELLDLLVHTGQSIKALIQLEMTLSSLKEAAFNQKSFSDVYLQCKYAYTGGDAPRLARTRCSDIIRDVRRINFKAAKFLWTQVGQWDSVNKAFENLMEADRTFLDDFEESLRAVDAELDRVMDLLRSGETTAAWQAYDELRKKLHTDVEALRDIQDALTKAEDHIRQNL